MLHVVIIDDQVAPNRTVFHAIRQVDGTWQGQWGNVDSVIALQGNGAIPAPPNLLTCSLGNDGVLHLLTIAVDGRIYHTIRTYEGAWPVGWGDVRRVMTMSGHPDRLRTLPDYAAIACRFSYEQHLLVPSGGTLWHTIRDGDGGWRTPWGDVQQAMQDSGHPSLPNNDVVSATGAAGRDKLHVTALAGGKVWHTLRVQNGDWPQPWSDVSAMLRNGSGDWRLANPFLAASAWAANDDLLHVVVSDAAGRIWHTIRRPDGTWPFGWGDVRGVVAAGGPDPIGFTPIATCAAADDSTLHLVVHDAQAGLWHTVRRPDGTWMAWTDLNAVISI